MAEAMSLDSLESAMKDITTNMRSFSLCLRQLYVEKAVGTTGEAAAKFRKIRDDTRNDAFNYLNSVLPETTNLISSIDEFVDFINRQDESGEESINEMVGECADLSTEVKEMHRGIIETLRKREQEFQLIQKELLDYEKKLDKKKESRERNYKWKKGLTSFLPSERLRIFSYESFYRKDLIESIAYGEQANTLRGARQAVFDTLIPSLKAYVVRFENIANFFSRLKINIKNLTNDSIKARKISKYCQHFVRSLPSVRTDLLAIPAEGTDENYIDRWLRRELTASPKTMAIAGGPETADPNAQNSHNNTAESDSKYRAIAAETLVEVPNAQNSHYKKAERDKKNMAIADETGQLGAKHTKDQKKSETLNSKTLKNEQTIPHSGHHDQTKHESPERNSNFNDLKDAPGSSYCESYPQTKNVFYKKSNTLQQETSV